MLASCDPCLPARSSRRGSTTRGNAPPDKAARACWAHVRTLKAPVCSGRLPAPTEPQAKRASCFRRFCASEARRRRAFARKQGAGDISHASAGARASPCSHKSCSHTLLVQSPTGFQVLFRYRGMALQICYRESNLAQHTHFSGNSRNSNNLWGEKATSQRSQLKKAGARREGRLSEGLFLRVPPCLCFAHSDTHSWM